MKYIITGKRESWLYMDVGDIIEIKKNYNHTDWDCIEVLKSNGSVWGRARTAENCIEALERHYTIEPYKEEQHKSDISLQNNMKIYFDGVTYNVGKFANTSVAYNPSVYKISSKADENWVNINTMGSDWKPEDFIYATYVKQFNLGDEVDCCNRGISGYIDEIKSVISKPVEYTIIDKKGYKHSGLTYEELNRVLTPPIDCGVWKVNDWHFDYNGLNFCNRTWSINDEIIKIKNNKEEEKEDMSEEQKRAKMSLSKRLLHDLGLVDVIVNEEKETIVVRDEDNYIGKAKPNGGDSYDALIGLAVANLFYDLGDWKPSEIRDALDELSREFKVAQKQKELDKKTRELHRKNKEEIKKFEEGLK